MKSEHCEELSLREKVLCQQDLYEILPFGKTKTKQLINSGMLPLIKIGKDYVTTFNLIEKWIEENAGKEIYI